MIEGAVVTIAPASALSSPASLRITKIVNMSTSTSSSRSISASGVALPSTASGDSGGPSSRSQPRPHSPSSSAVAAAATTSSSSTFNSPPTSQLPRLPGISSLLAGMQGSHDPFLSSSEYLPPRRLSMTKSDERSTSATKSTGTHFGSLPRSAPIAFAGWDDPSPFSNSMPSTPLAVAAPLFPRPSISTSKLMPLAIATGAGAPPQSSLPLRSISSTPPNASPRLSTGQLVSPTGGPLHPLPSGLVGFAPLSPSQSDRAAPAAFRPRSNSLSMHPYANPYHHRAATYEHDQRRRGSLTDGIARPSSSSGWSPTIPSEAHFSSHAVAAARARKHAQETGWSADRAGPPGAYGSRPRAASISTADEFRPVLAWADHERDAAMRQARSTGGRVNSMASTASSPLTGPESDARTEAMEHLELARERPLAGLGSREPVGSILATSPSPDARLAIEHGRQHGRLSLGGAPDVTGLHITSFDGRRGLNPSVPVIIPFTGGPVGQGGPLTHGSPAMPRGAEYQSWARTSPNLPGTGSFPSQPHLAPGAAEDGAVDANEVGRYGCPHCSKRFARPSSLRTHIHSHTGEKPFTCNTCGRGFSVQSNLRRHLKIHRGSGLAQSTTGADGDEERGGGPSDEEEGSHSDEGSDELENQHMEGVAS